MKRLFTLFAVAALLPALADGQDSKPKSYDSAWDLVRSEHDRNKDGKVTAAEYPRGEERFQRLDRNGDGALTEADFEGDARGEGRGGRGARGGRGGGRPERGQAPKAGEMAPDFALKSKDGKSTVKLSSFRGQKPVALIFGSYT